MAGVDVVGVMELHTGTILNAAFRSSFAISAPFPRMVNILIASSTEEYWRKNFSPEMWLFMLHPSGADNT